MHYCRAHAFRHAHHGLGIGIEHWFVGQRVVIRRLSLRALRIIGRHQAEYRLHS